MTVTGRQVATHAASAAAGAVVAIIIVIGYSLPHTDAEALSLFGEIAPPPNRPRITLVCGPKGAPETYSQIPSRSVDTKLYFEDYVASILG